MVMEEQQLDMELDSERVPVPQVQKPSQLLNTESPQKNKGIGRGKPRYRKKMLHAAILKQMEFYFSDANLSKDRFLSNLIEEDPYVDLSIFMSFNKIRELTTDVHRIAKALQKSTMLTVSEDGTKVQRVTPIVRKENVEECSVYAQNLPPDADHEWLQSIFSQYGPIDYISIPRYKSNKKIKGFAFIEFQSPKSAVECLKAYRKKGCLLPSSTSPNELLSISTYEADKEPEDGQGKTKRDVNISVKESKDVGKKNNQTKVENEKSQGDCTKPKMERKRKYEAMDCNDEPGNSVENNREDTGNSELEKPDEDKVKEEIVESEEDAKLSKKGKKRKQKDTELTETSDPNSLEPNEIEDTESKKHKKRKSKSSDECVNSVEQENVNDDDDQHSYAESDGKHSDDSVRKEKRKKKSKISDESMDTNVVASREEENVANDEKKKRKKRKKRSKMDEDNDIVGLQVMAKKDWKHLRNKYLDLQKSKMKQLKQHLRKTRWNQWSTCDKNKHDNNDAKEEKEKPAKDPENPIPFVPGVIVKMELNEPCTEPKKFKADLKGNNAIKFIDIAEGSYEAYIRCDNAEAAKVFTQKSDQNTQMCILQGEEEHMYWQKILQDRKEKLGNKNRPKQRGRDKLLKKAEKELGKHIKFDEV